MYQLVQLVAPILISAFKDTSNFNINIMESDKEVISRLKFISKIQKSEKINVKYMIVQSDCLKTSLSRTFFNQCNRQNTLNFIRNTIKNTFEIIQKYSTSNNESEKHVCKNILFDLDQSQKGLVNIKSTYLDDLKVCCDIDTLLQEIDAFLSINKEYYKTNNDGV
jgi:hypothetical protein